MTYVDDRLIFDCEAPDITSQGRIGLRTFRTVAQFKNVNVKPIRTP